MRDSVKKFLPIGTVVMLKEGKKRLMITGFYVAKDENSDKIWDYCGCLYPEGIVSINQNVLFNHDQIETIYFYGLVDEEEKEFKKRLNENILKNNNL